jgi:hypothetical protein
MKKYKRYEEQKFQVKDKVQIKKGKYKDYFGIITSLSISNYYLITLLEDPEGEPLMNSPKDFQISGNDIILDK